MSLETKRVMRDVLRAKMQIDRSAQRTDRLAATLWGLVLLLFAWQRQWAVVAFSAMAAVFCLVILPRVQRSSRQSGWVAGMHLAYKIAERHGVGSEPLMEMFLAGTMGPPSDRANLDQERLLLRELEAELGDDEL